MAGINRTTGKATDLITFSRASGGTALRKISYGSELVTNGGFDSASGWTLGAGWTISGGELVATSATGVASQVISLTGGKVYRITADNTANIQIRIVGGSGQSLGYFSGADVDKIFVFTAGAGSLLEFVANGTTTGIIDNISVKEVLFDQPDGTLTLFNHPTNIPRIEYAADGTVKGLLIEEARTNLVAPSNDFDAAFISQTGVNVSPAHGTSPDRAVNADKLIADTSTGFHRIAKTGIATSSGVDYSYSCFFKAAGETVAGLALFDGTNWLGRASVDLTTGVASVSNGSAKVDDFGNGWYRLTIYGTSLGTSHTAYIYVKSLFSSTGNGTDGVLAYGAQLEAGSFPTSYIPTSGATATRAADIASISVDNFGYRQDAGTVVVEIDPYVYADGEYYVSLNDGTTAERAEILYSSDVYATMVSGGVQGSAINLGDNTGVLKISSALKTNDAAACLNGGVAVTDTLTTMPVGVTTMTIGKRAVASGSSNFNGHIKSIAYYPRRLSNAQLQELTA